MENVFSLQTELVWEALYTNAEFAKMPPYAQGEIAATIERSCFNRALRVCDEQGVPAIWDNDDFQRIYNIILYNMRVHLDVNSTSHSPSFIGQVINSAKIYVYVGPTYAPELTKDLDMMDLENIAEVDDISKCPEKNKRYVDDIEARSNIKIQRKYSEIYFCKRCRSKKCVTELLQLRSLDEGMSERIECDACGFSWIIM